MSTPRLRWPTVVGIACVVLGVVIVLVAAQFSGPAPGAAMRHTEPTLPPVVLGRVLLTTGVVLAVGLLGFVLRVRRRTR